MGKLTVSVSDPYFNNVKLLLHMNGVNGSTTFTDSSKNNSAITINGNPQTSTAQSKFGASSAYFDGDESYLDVSNLPSDYLSQDFTIEAWVWVDSTKINSTLFNTFPHNSLGISLNREETGLTNVFIGDGDAWTANLESDTPLSFDTWQHVALVRSNNTITLYENGIARGSINDVPTGFNTSCRIGSITYEGGLNEEEHQGYMDELRITKGIARYTSNFVPQNKEFYDEKIIKNISIKKQNTGSGKIQLYKFLPNRLQGLSLWLKADAGVTTSGSNVTAWADQSVNGRNASSYNDPQLITNQINGKPVIDFDATQYFTSENQNLNNNSSIFFVVKSREDHGIIFSTSDYEGLVFALTENPNNSFSVGISNLFEIANDGADNGNNWMIGSTIRSNNLTSIIYKNGTQVATGSYDTSSLNPTDNLIIGTDSDLNSYWNLDGQIAEIIIYNRALTISERQQVEAYLNSKYAIY